MSETSNAENSDMATSIKHNNLPLIGFSVDKEMALRNKELSWDELTALVEKYKKTGKYESLIDWLKNIDEQNIKADCIQQREDLIAEYNTSQEAKKNSEKPFTFTFWAPHYFPSSPFIAQKWPEEKNTPEINEDDRDIEGELNTETPEKEEKTEENPSQETALAETPTTESASQASPEAQTQPEKPKDKYVSETAAEIKAGEKSGSFVVSTKESVLNVRNEKWEKISTLQKWQEIQTTGNFVELWGEKFVEIKNNQFVSAEFLEENPQTEVAKNTETPENTTLQEKTEVAETNNNTTLEKPHPFASLDWKKLNQARTWEEVFIWEGVSVTSHWNNFRVQQADTSFTVKLSDITHKNDQKETVFNTAEQLKNTFSAQYNTELAKNELKSLEQIIAKTEIPAPENVKSQFKNGEISFDNVKLSKDAHNQTVVHLDLDTKGFNKKEHKNLEFVLWENMIASWDIQQTLQTMIASHLELNQNPNKAITQTNPIDNSSKV